MYIRETLLIGYDCGETISEIFGLSQLKAEERNAGNTLKECSARLFTACRNGKNVNVK